MVEKHHLPKSVLSYLQRRSEPGPWLIAGLPEDLFAGAIVIPALAESTNLPQTLQSLADNPPDLLQRFLVLVVVNQAVTASGADQADNLATLSKLPLWRQQFGLKSLCWVDAAAPGYELPAKQGVGLARKIGLDLALSQLEYTGGDPLLICLDADTLVQPDYLPAMVCHFATTVAGGASIPYCHRPAVDPAGQAAIDRYELFLRAYVLGLELAGSPYAFHTVGSAMACRASAYVAAGGMNRRLAGEDFYFLQQVHKTSMVVPLSGTVVHPSPRSSHRVPFGTGRAVGEMLAAGGNQLLFYHPELFAIVQAWLALVAEQSALSGDQLLLGAARISPPLQSFLMQAGFTAAWDNLQRHNPKQHQLLTAFHGWFDAFRTMRLMHHLTDCGYPRIEPVAAVAPLLERVGHLGPGTVCDQLAIVRQLQGVSSGG